MIKPQVIKSIRDLFKLICFKNVFILKKVFFWRGPMAPWPLLGPYRSELHRPIPVKTSCLPPNSNPGTKDHRKGAFVDGSWPLGQDR